MRRMRAHSAAVLATTLAFGIATQFANATPFSDFDDGTFQGWAPDTSPFGGGPFGGDLDLVLSGGNPGGFIRATNTDTPNLPISGPAEFRGDLSAYSEVRWDEFIYPNTNPPVSKGTEAILVGADGTYYRSPRPLLGTGVWQARSVDLIASEWTLWAPSGSATFEDVLSDAILVFNMDVATTTFPTTESGIDNIALVPEPGASLLLLTGIAILRRRK